MRNFFNRAFHDVHSTPFALVTGVLTLAALFSIGAVITEYFFTEYAQKLFYLDWLATILFTLEYCARIWVAKKKRRYIFSTLGIIDFISILPSYLGIGNFNFLKSIRVVRTFRLMRYVSIVHNTKYLKRKR